MRQNNKGLVLLINMSVYIYVCVGKKKEKKRKENIGTSKTLDGLWDEILKDVVYNFFKKICGFWVLQKNNIINRILKIRQLKDWILMYL